uniref:Galaxin-like repeats domain-containing protein n=1 Tax=Strigamia maritima TaxID=126957 RepID=T1JDL2_STRMM
MEHENTLQFLLEISSFIEMTEKELPGLLKKFELLFEKSVQKFIHIHIQIATGGAIHTIYLHRAVKDHFPSAMLFLYFTCFILIPSNVVSFNGEQLEEEDLDMDLGEFLMIIKKFPLGRKSDRKFSAAENFECRKQQCLQIAVLSWHPFLNFTFLHFFAHFSVHRREPTTEKDTFLHSRKFSVEISAKWELSINLTALNVYNPLTEKCCKGTVHRGNNLVTECCGSNIYDKSTQLCCNGQVHDMKYGYLCCGETVYNTKTSTCCYNVVSQLPQDIDVNNVACCDKNAYDTTKQLCCSSSEYGYKLLSVDKQNKDDTACCGNRTYNPETSSCCTDIVNGISISELLQHRGNRTMCCGTQLFDPEEQEASMGCCGNTTFNYKTQLCCYTPTGFKVTPKMSSSDYCCGDEVYNTLTQMCCDDKVLDNADGKRVCCGQETINTEKQVCCYSDGTMQSVNKKSQNDTGCCGTVPFDFNNGLCCYENDENVLVEKSNPDEYMCCGLKSYNPSKDMCCLNGESSKPNVYHGGIYNKICCGDKSIDINTHYCCGGVAVAFSAGNVACCGNELLYDPSVETCCWDNQVNVKPKLFPFSEGMSCCGDRMYNRSSNEQCCDGKLHRMNAGGVNEACCGDRVYDYKKQICCGDNILPKADDQSQCCYTYISDEDKDCLFKVQPHIEKVLSNMLGQWRSVY